MKRHNFAAHYILTLLPLLALVSVSMLSLVAGPYQGHQPELVEIDQVRRELARAQQQWLEASPNLEKELMSGSPSKVLGELEIAEKAGVKFAEVETKYREMQLARSKAQTQALLSSPGLIDQEKVSQRIEDGIKKQMEESLEDQSAIRTALEELKKRSNPSQNEILQIDALNKELAQSVSGYSQLGEQLTELEKVPNAPDPRPAREAILGLQKQLESTAENRLGLAKQQERLIKSLYANYRAAVESRLGPDASKPSKKDRHGSQQAADISSSLASSQVGTPPAPREASNPAGSLRPEFKGTWLLPEVSGFTKGYKNDPSACPLKSASLVVKVPEPLTVEANLQLSFSTTDANCKGVKGSEEIPLHGEAKGWTVELLPVASSPKRDIVITLKLDNSARNNGSLSWHIGLGRNKVASGNEPVTRNSEGDATPPVTAAPKKDNYN